MKKCLSLFLSFVFLAQSFIFITPARAANYTGDGTYQVRSTFDVITIDNSLNITPKFYEDVEGKEEVAFFVTNYLDQPLGGATRRITESEQHLQYFTYGYTGNSATFSAKVEYLDLNNGVIDALITFDSVNSYTLEVEKLTTENLDNSQTAAKTKFTLETNVNLSQVIAEYCKRGATLGCTSPVQGYFTVNTNDSVAEVNGLEFNTEYYYHLQITTGNGLRVYYPSAAEWLTFKTKAGAQEEVAEPTETEQDEPAESTTPAPSESEQSQTNDNEIYLNQEKSYSNLVDATFTSQHLGKIFLQVQAHGEAWYIRPSDHKRYYLGTAEQAYNIMRETGIGITNTDLAKIAVDADIHGPTAYDSDSDGLNDALEVAIGTNPLDDDSDNDGYKDKIEMMGGYNPAGAGKLPLSQSFTKQHLGKIFLQVESHGEAWYVNPANSKRYFLGRAEDAYAVMRLLGIGITSDNLHKIGVGEL